MKSKKIPVDIKSKSIKEAQNEIKDIISNLENEETNLQNSMDKYSRMMNLNQHIQDKFREKLSTIKVSKLENNKRSLSKK